MDIDLRNEYNNEEDNDTSLTSDPLNVPIAFDFNLAPLVMLRENEFHNLVRCDAPYLPITTHFLASLNWSEFRYSPGSYHMILIIPDSGVLKDALADAPNIYTRLLG